jgi:tetratricopeptide (TPR) repeat protein
MQDVRDWPRLDPLAPHAQAVAGFADAAGITEPTARLFSGTGVLFQAKALYGAAEPVLRRALAIIEASLGGEHPTVATCLNNLAQLLQATNRLAEAEPLIRRALAIDEASLGGEHPDVAVDFNNLAQLLQDTNRLAEAEPLMRRALAIDEASLGDEHPAVARDLNAVVLVLSSASRGNVALTRIEQRDADGTTSTPPAHDLVGMGKESGDVEYSADSVFVLCPEAWAEGEPPLPGGRAVHLAVAKVRAGRAGWHELRFDGSRFIEAPQIDKSKRAKLLEEAVNKVKLGL